MRETEVAAARIATFATCKLVLRASEDFASVSAEVVTEERTIPLDARAHWYVIWALADHRLKRSKKPESATDPREVDGWMDMDLLAIRAEKPRAALDTYISLARRQLLRAGVVGGDRVVEAEAGIRRIGLPPAQIELVGPGQNTPPTTTPTLPP